MHMDGRFLPLLACSVLEVECSLQSFVALFKVMQRDILNHAP